jgi:hypothetical protein
LAQDVQISWRSAKPVPSCHRRGADCARSGKIPQPKMVNGVQQRPVDGVSMLYSTDNAKAADRRTTVIC